MFEREWEFQRQDSPQSRVRFTERAESDSAVGVGGKRRLGRDEVDQRFTEDGAANGSGVGPVVPGIRGVVWFFGEGPSASAPLVEFVYVKRPSW